MSMCEICLRTELQLLKLGRKLYNFYMELNGYAVKKKVVFCATCKHYLNKCLQFKQLCEESTKILKNWRKKPKPEIALNNLHSRIAPLFNKIVESEIIITETKISPNTTDIKEETEKNGIIIENDDSSFKINDNSPKINDNFVENNETIQNNDSLVVKNDFLIEPKEESDFNYSEINGSNNDSDIKKNDNDMINDNHMLKDIDLTDDSQDDKIINQFLKDIQKKSNKSKKKNEECGFDKNDNDKINDNDLTDDSEDDKFISQLLKDIEKTSSKSEKKNEKRGFDKNDKPAIVRKRSKQPLKNKQEFESIFDIEYFRNDDEAKAEFAERRHSDYYKNAVFKCTVCFTAFRCQKLLDYHMKWHNPSSGEFPCNICQMRFKTYVSMRKHKNNTHYGRYKCKMCPLITYHKFVMINHSRKHQGVEYKCKHCPKVYRHSSTHLTHERTAHRSRHACADCARTFVSPVGLRQHRQKVHQSTTQVNKDGVHCTECDLTFANEDVYIIHVLHTPIHKQLASTIIACPECGKRFEDKLSLRTHRRQSHPNYSPSWSKNADKTGANREYNCRECGATGLHNAWLYNHYRSKHPQVSYDAVYVRTKTHLCDQCGKSFVHRWHLSQHTLLHSGLRPHTCATCGATFRTSSALRMHSERHLPPNRPCTVCGKKFVSASNLHNHMKSHIGERRYKCSVCSKGFLHSAALREHVRGVHLHVRRDRRPKGHTVVAQSENT